MPFDHQYIEAHDVTNRYVQKKLTLDERRQFEQHLPDCPECLDRLALAQVFSHDAEDPVHESPLPLAAQFGRLPASTQRIALGLAALFVGGTPTAFFLGSWLGLRKQSEETARSKVLLLVDPSSPGFSSYGVAVTDTAGKVVRANTGLHLPGGKVLALPMDLDGLPPGDYLVTVRGRRPDGSSMLVQSYSLRAVPVDAARR